MIFKTLLHALLLLCFDDIRAEEWTSSYAGKSARMDFLLKNEGVVIEVKKTRLGLTDKELEYVDSDYKFVVQTVDGL